MKCPHCKKAPWPLKDDNGKFLWKNLFKIDFFSVSFILVVLFMSWAYQQDVEQYQEIKEDPGGFCNNWCSMNNQWADSSNITPAYGKIDYKLINITHEKEKYE